jgi:hypothetical protein
MGIAGPGPLLSGVSLSFPTFVEVSWSLLPLMGFWIYSGMASACELGGLAALFFLANSFAAPHTWPQYSYKCAVHFIQDFETKAQWFR